MTKQETSERVSSLEIVKRSNEDIKIKLEKLEIKSKNSYQIIDILAIFCNTLIPTISKKQTKNSFLQNNFFYIERLHKLKYQTTKPSLINKSSEISYIHEFPQKRSCH